MIDLRYVEFYWPVFALGALAILFALTFRYPAGSFRLNIHVAVLEKHVHVPRKWMLRGLIIIMGGVIALLAYNSDYSPYFNQEVTFRVSFDNREIASALSSLHRSRYGGEYNICSDWLVLQDSVCSELDKRVGFDPQKGRAYFSCKDRAGVLTGRGHATHEVRQVTRWRQRYEFLQITGGILLTLACAGKEKIPQDWHYELAATSDRYFNGDPRDLLRMATVVSPVMRQSHWEKGRRVFEADVVGVSMVQFFPLPHLEWSLFCVRRGECLVPLSIGIYE